MATANLGTGMGAGLPLTVRVLGVGTGMGEEKTDMCNSKMIAMWLLSLQV
jgi:hypothetical protein